MKSVPKKFYVTCVESTEMVDAKGEIINKVEKGEEFKVTLNEESDMYFTRDSQVREVYVGYRDINGVVHIHECFKLLPISQFGFKFKYGNVDIMRTL